MGVETRIVVIADNNNDSDKIEDVCRCRIRQVQGAGKYASGNGAGPECNDVAQGCTWSVGWRFGMPSAEDIEELVGREGKSMEQAVLSTGPGIQ